MITQEGFKMEKLFNNGSYIEKPERRYIDCVNHGKAEALINGACRLCKEDHSRKEAEINFKHDIQKKKIERGVPERYLDFNLSNYPTDTEKQHQLILNLSSYDFKSNVVMLGTPGTGKTRLACSLIDKALQENISCFYVKYYRLIKIAIEDKALFKRITESKFLVIDEFGISDTDNKIQLLFELFDQRYDSMKATMLISNLKGDQLKEKLGDALYSRIKDDCQFYECKWQDYRLRKVS
jgi:DNA replication protein DnaC